MTTKIKFYFALIFLMAFTAVSRGNVPTLLYPSKLEQEKMLEEADDFIDEMAEGQQDLQADAVYHSLHGMGGELENLRKSRLTPGKNVEGVIYQDIRGDGVARGIKMRLYKPKNLKVKPNSDGKDAGSNTSKPLPLLVYFHGGGWTIGGIESCRRFCESLALTGDMMVLAVDYSLAPENPYPSGLEDCEAALEYAVAHAKEWGSDPGLVSVGGDSAGGNLAVASAIYYSEKASNKEKLRSLVLVYPVLKAYNDKSASWRKYTKGYGLDGRLMEAFSASYLFENTTPDISKDPMVSPFHGNDKQLKALPPVLMISAERDILADQGKEFSDRLQKLGHSIERIEFPGAIHLFATVEGQPTAFKKAVLLISAFMKK